ncbi:PIG-L deacetylase family protein [Streptomyces sp. ALI-76-A]|jgi:LmbE family N-acetylglucosaminyl deacetylase|uniref:PIG-L deacetylase family protein n=1 Tax=Streptomyces sp. ALI-76-A TaxID=3025736 RepID=UPI00256F3853|nr:PIG-L deacetylase family protein [Streptomyces sp. ALI-76-A]MDL5200789.1 PIG-L deacetylase family protein [Streptomyces sp. ALI-76-A]
MTTHDDAGGFGAGAPLAPLPEDWERCLAVAAHPDDIEYGAASAVARWTAQGKRVTYLLVTRGEAGIDGLHPDEAGPLREAEERAGAREVGVDTVEFLGHRDGAVESGPALRRDIVRAIRRHRPEVLVSGAFTVRMVGGVVNQADHRVVGLAALDAARDAGNRWIFPELADEGLEPWGGVRFVCFGGAERPTHGVDVTGEPLERGIASLAAHAEYTKGLGSQAFAPRPFLTWAARQGGPALGVEAAVLFDVFPLAFEGPPPWEG